MRIETSPPGETMTTPLFKKLLAGLMAGAALTGALLCGALSAQAAEVHYDAAPINLNDKPSLQRGAKIFVNYCLSCHSAAAMRYNRLQDLGLTEQDIKGNLLFTDHKIGETMIAAINPAQAKEWFGANPPDLTVIARARGGEGVKGADYIYTLFRSFYRDPNRPTGWNNIVFPNIGMPHPLWELQGEREPVFKTENVYGHDEQVFTGTWRQVTSGTLSTAEYDRTVGDLVNYLQWMGEPVQTTRTRIGIWVMVFMLLCTFIAWKLNAAYWKDVK
jgi:ubiquinol-cytochrome c reductase cytochrome c1 subunit